MLKFYTIILLFLSSFLSFAQEDESLQKGYYPFINYQKNEIFLGQETALNYFFKNMDSLANGEDKQVNIVHIGDSHIQADFFSNQMRKRSQTTFHLGNGGKGFIFPYRLAKTNNPNSYKVSYTGTWTGKRIISSSEHYDWGVSGIVASTYSVSSTFSIQLNAEKDTSVYYNTNKIRVYYPVNDSHNFEIFIQYKGESIEGTINQEGGYTEFHLETPIDEIHFKLKKTNPAQNHFHLEGILLNNDESGIVYHSIGINGARFNSYLRCPKFIPQLKSLNPHLVILSLGTNDVYGPNPLNSSEFKQHVIEIIKWIREASPNTSILLTCPSDNLYKKKSPNYNNAKVGKAFLELAEEYNLAVWDLYTVMGGLSSIYQWQKKELAASDYVHFTAKGYILQGELLFQALIMDSYFGKYQQILTIKH